MRALTTPQIVVLKGLKAAALVGALAFATVRDLPSQSRRDLFPEPPATLTSDETRCLNEVPRESFETATIYLGVNSGPFRQQHRQAARLTNAVTIRLRGAIRAQQMGLESRALLPLDSTINWLQARGQFRLMVMSDGQMTLEPLGPPEATELPVDAINELVAELVANAREQTHPPLRWGAPEPDSVPLYITVRAAPESDASRGSIPLRTVRQPRFTPWTAIPPTSGRPSPLAEFPGVRGYDLLFRTYISALGEVDSVTPLRADWIGAASLTELPPAFVQMVADNLMRWRYEPGRIGGCAVRGEIPMSIAGGRDR